MVRLDPMAHDTSNVTTPVSDPSPGNAPAPFSSLGPDISSPISEGNKAIEANGNSHSVLTSHLPYGRSALTKDAPPLNKSTRKAVPTKDSSRAGTATGKPDKSGSRSAAGEWSVPHPKRLARIVNAQTTLPASVQRPDKRVKSRPTADDFRSTGRDGAVLDPALSADEDEGPPQVNDEVDKGRVASSLVKKSDKATKKTGKETTCTPPLEDSMDIDAPSVEKQTLIDVNDPSIKVGAHMASKVTSAGLPGDKTNVDPRATKNSKGSTSLPGALPSERVGALDSLRFRKGPATVPSTPAALSAVKRNPAPRSEGTPLQIAPMVLPKGVSGLLRREPETTPLNHGQMTRTSSSTTSIMPGLLPNLAKASLSDMKEMRGIWVRDKENAAANVSELRRAGHHLIAPGAFEFQDRHLRMVTRFCSQLDAKIEEAERDGRSDEIEVIDLTMDDPDDSSLRIVGGSTSSKRPVDRKQAVT
ncbi:hypothetical protein PGT21_000770 [Puccinia graminis f. sp. tritici]|uniref:Uncharacterized protein n=1 Tax=Puccinia graminis f. sp. tritici TaxID=56615 RepID=A0A5B0M328_PUCGR|nr:hypothetical protein PGT21_000770 [Puccinia graminis f. sp. tritici]